MQAVHVQDNSNTIQLSQYNSHNIYKYNTIQLSQYLQIS